MVSLNEQTAPLATQELGEAIEAIRRKYEAKKCDHKNVTGVFALVFYEDGHCHPAVMGDFVMADVIKAALWMCSDAQEKGVVIPIG